jgi:hypothetical protein
MNYTTDDGAEAFIELSKHFEDHVNEEVWQGVDPEAALVAALEGDDFEQVGVER